MTASNNVLMAPLYHLELVQDRDIAYNGNASTTEGAAEVFHKLLDKSPIEQMVVLYLANGGKIVGAEKVGMGTVEMVSTLPTELFRGAIVKAVPEIILCHNHPSGEPKPSTPDMQYTMSVVELGAVLGVRVRDHIIVSPNGKHISMREKMESGDLDQEFVEARADRMGLPEELKEKLMSILHPGLSAQKKKLDPKACCSAENKSWRVQRNTGTCMVKVAYHLLCVAHKNTKHMLPD